MAHIYLIKDSNGLISHCKCSKAYISWPGQADCPWCGCGWLFTCLKCRKAFTFARGVEVDTPLTDFARQDLTRRRGQKNVSKDDIAHWVTYMEEFLQEVKIGQQYVYLDGAVIPTDTNQVAFNGWHSRHNLDCLPQVTALQDAAIIDNVLSNIDYWVSTEITDVDSDYQDDTLVKTDR